MKKSILNSKDEMTPYLPITDKKSLKSGQNKLHTKAVSAAKSNYGPNRVLNHTPPEIDKSELTLMRDARTKLAQLRSGFSTLTNEYKNRIDPNIPNKCPECKKTPHDVKHLFNCKKNPTSLTPIDLWKKPIHVARFLKIDGT